MTSTKKMLSWMHTSLSARETETYGMALFAQKEIKKGELLIVFGGHAMTMEEEESLPERIRDIAIQIAPGIVLGIRDEQELSYTDYVNHSCDPNCGIKGQVSLVSRRDIHPGEEITFDYGTILFSEEGDSPYSLDCLCGVKECRGKITDHDWEDPIFQEKHKGFLPYYIQDVIDKHKNNP